MGLPLHGSGWSRPKRAQTRKTPPSGHVMTVTVAVSTHCCSPGQGIATVSAWIDCRGGWPPPPAASNCRLCGAGGVFATRWGPPWIPSRPLSASVPTADRARAQSPRSRPARDRPSAAVSPAVRDKSLVSPGPSRLLGASAQPRRLLRCASKRSALTRKPQRFRVRWNVLSEQL